MISGNKIVWTIDTKFAISFNLLISDASFTFFCLYIDNKYAVEAAELMIDYGFNVLNLHRLWAEIYSIDEAKKTFFDIINFKLDGELRQTYWHNNQWHNSLFYSLLSDD